MPAVTFVGITGHVPAILPVTFTGTAVTFPESPVTLDRNTHHAAIAVACGCTGTRINEAGQLAPALDAWFRDGGPSLLDVSIDPAAFPPLALYDGNDPMASTTLHIVA